MASTGTEDKKHINNAVLSVEVLNWLAKYIKKPPPGETWRAVFDLGDGKDLFVKVENGTVFLAEAPNRVSWDQLTDGSYQCHGCRHFKVD